MKYTFKCHACYKIQLCDSKEEVQALKSKHWRYEGNRKIHNPFKETMHLETRSSKKTGKSYLVLVADD